MKCGNVYCKFQEHNGKCSISRKVVIGRDAKCQNFEKGFTYYFYHITSVMSSNFICVSNLNDDVRISIYYLMKCLPIAFAVDDIRGIVVVRNTKTGNLLHINDILEMIEDLDNEALLECIEEFNEKGVPVIIKDIKEEYHYKEYGWLSPTGEYKEAQFGDHEKSARIIIEHKKFKDFKEWSYREDTSGLARDYLVHEKGYALIHDPSGLQRYIVTHNKPLTNKQKDFLYGFFIDMGMTNRAEEYVE